jgi:hypothetical protein
VFAHFGARRILIALFPGGAEPDGLGEADVAEAVGEQGHAAALLCSGSR